MSGWRALTAVVAGAGSAVLDGVDAPIGWHLLSQAGGSYDPMLACENYNAILSLEELAAEAARLPSRPESGDDLPERVCFSARILNPNGVVVRDMSSRFGEIPWGSDYIYLGPHLVSSGMITYSLYGNQIGQVSDLAHEDD